MGSKKTIVIGPCKTTVCWTRPIERDLMVMEIGANLWLPNKSARLVSRAVVRHQEKDAAERKGTVGRLFFSMARILCQSLTSDFAGCCRLRYRGKRTRFSMSALTLSALGVTLVRVDSGRYPRQG